MIPEDCDLFLGGGRGSAKSYTMGIIGLRHAEQYRDKARILFLRQTYKGLSDFEQITRDIFGLAYGSAASYNASENVWRLPGGGYFELGQLQGPGDYPKYQGRSFTLLMIDEAGQYSSPVILDMVRSNLRGPRNMPIRMIVAANPGGPGHLWLAGRYVFRAAPWEPFLEPKSGRKWVYCPGTYKDNPHIDGDEYLKNLEASCPSDPELLKAWLNGDWSVIRGAFFGPVLEESRNAVDPWAKLPDQLYHHNEWNYYLAHDYGYSAPSATYLIARSPGEKGPDGRFYPRDSLVLIDELATALPGQPNTGLQWTIDRISDEIWAMLKKWGLKRADGVADDACFSNMGSSSGSIADEFRRYKINFRPANKGSRIAGWNRMRQLLSDAGSPDKAGLYISRKCGYFWETVPTLGRCPRNAEDLDSSQADHAADAVRYGCLRQRLAATTHRVRAD